MCHLYIQPYIWLTHVFGKLNKPPVVCMKTKTKDLNNKLFLKCHITMQVYERKNIRIKTTPVVGLHRDCKV